MVRQDPWGRIMASGAPILQPVRLGQGRLLETQPVSTQQRRAVRHPAGTRAAARQRAIPREAAVVLQVAAHLRATHQAAVPPEAAEADRIVEAAGRIDSPRAV